MNTAFAPEHIGDVAATVAARTELIVTLAEPVTTVVQEAEVTLVRTTDCVEVTEGIVRVKEPLPFKAAIAATPFNV